jgi:hypothetical protein
VTRKDLHVECLKYQLFFAVEVDKHDRFPRLVGSWADVVQLEIWRKELEIKEIESHTCIQQRQKRGPTRASLTGGE